METRGSQKLSKKAWMKFQSSEDKYFTTILHFCYDEFEVDDD